MFLTPRTRTEEHYKIKNTKKKSKVFYFRDDKKAIEIEAIAVTISFRTTETAKILKIFSLSS